MCKTSADATLQDITSRKCAQEQNRRQFERLVALRAIDVAILTSRNIRFTLNVVVDQAIAVLGVDGAAVLLLHPARQTLDYITTRGFGVDARQRTTMRLGEGYAGQIAQEGRPMTELHLQDALRSPHHSYPALEEGFQEYYGVPLIAHDRILGVLEVYRCSTSPLDEGWLGFLETLAGQAAIAIDQIALLDDLQRANQELIASHDVAIEGWSHALDLRDKETEGHSERVMDLTLRLAEAMGIGPTERTHIRRGALLHDIGKMGVPDQILHKPGPLTEEEWAVMEKHPEYAYELLYPIVFLRPALEIPLCHHERWDGSGYPNGLKGEQIPLSARIFAVVDVWDALRSDRPYRPGWPPEQILNHINSLSGSHFDPEVVEAFLNLMRLDSAREDTQ